MSTEAWIAVAACAALGAVNIAALTRVRRALRVLTAYTRALRAGIVALAEETHALENRVNRLTAAVGQTREQFHRALELTSTIHLQLYGKLGSSAMTDHDASTISTQLIELKAIAVVNGDTELIELVGWLRSAVEEALAAGADADRPTLKRNVSEATERVQRRVYSLLADATRPQPASR